jgi:hypothetical protein
MANLTEISIGTRKFFIWIGILTVIYIIIQFLFNLGITYWKNTHPAAPILPNSKFGKLPRLTFPNDATTSAGIVFALENIEGAPPITTASALIYSMPKKQMSILTDDRANKFAVQIGFTVKGEPLNPSYYYYTDPKDNLRTMLLDIINLNYEIKYDYKTNPDKIFSIEKFTGKEAAINEVKTYLSGSRLFDSSILNGITKADLLIYDKQSKIFNPTNDIKAANAMRINYFRENLNNWKILPPNFVRSYNYVLLTPSKTVKYLEISNTFWPIDFNDYGEYPLKSSDQAWKELNEGLGIIANLGNNSRDKITLRNIYLAYYDSEDPQGYLQPIFVFEGDNEFAAYVPAVSPEWVE